MRGTLFIFVKAPVAGSVKTRLAKTLGPGRAAAIYRRLTANTIAQAKSGPWRTVLAVDPASSMRGFASLWPAQLLRAPQGKGNLGDRMGRLIDSAPKGPVVIIGSDAPSVRTRHIRAAFRSLGGADAVIGPAPDGGYWLIGFARRRGRAPDFDGVRWSSAHALEDTIMSLPNDWRIARLETLSDIDDGSDLAAAGAGALMSAPARTG